MAEKATSGTKKTETKVKNTLSAKILSLEGKATKDISLPEAFETELRPDLIQRAFVAEASWARQPYGTDPRAGFESTADCFTRRREYYRLTVNRGMSILPRQKLPGGGLGQVRFVPQSKGGHRAHPPKAEKIWEKKINEREWILALASAIGATTNVSLVTGENRNHAVSKDITLPLIVDNSFESIKKTKDAMAVFEKLGLSDDIVRAKDTKEKAGKARTGKKKTRISALVVVSGSCDGARAAENIAGVDVIDVDDLTVRLLAPGGNPGRLTLWTEGAIEKLLN